MWISHQLATKRERVYLGTNDILFISEYIFLPNILQSSEENP